jgi:uncharacterized membrane protein YphA (DoxX/SURF4 family)
MPRSVRNSQLALRIGLAIVFLWFGIDKFIQPQYWLDAWVPSFVQNFASGIHIGGRDLINLIGIFEVIVALSLLTGFFMRYFAVAAAVFLVSIIAIHGFNEVIIRDIGLVGALIAIIIWPERSYL